jgi:2-oxoglutarate ferredoxin oxidoreductase subunit delta
VIDESHCKGCTLCITACPQGVLFMADHRLNAHGYHPARLEDPAGLCSGCGLCAVICPEACITVYRTVQRKPIRAAALAAA